MGGDAGGLGIADAVSGAVGTTLEPRLAMARRFQVFTGQYPWEWKAADVEDWSTDLCHEWDTATLVVEQEPRPAVRPLTREEVQLLFDYADDQVEVARRLGRKGWQAAWRGAVWLKVVYGFGLRRREAAMLDVTNFSPNPQAAEFGRFGTGRVRWGKARGAARPGAGRC